MYTNKITNGSTDANNAPPFEGDSERGSVFGKPGSKRPPTEVVVVGAGHNGLVAAAILARSGRSVTVLEKSSSIGGAARTEYPFTNAPRLGCSTGAYLLGPMPPEVIQRTGIKPKLIPRRPHGFLLLDNNQPAAFGTPTGSTNISSKDQQALDHLDRVIAAIRDDLAQAWLKPAVDLQTSARLVRDEPAPGVTNQTYRALYLALATEPIGVWLERFGFVDRQLLASVATDAFVGSSAGPSTPGTGMNFLAHNMLRLPPGDGVGHDAEPLGAWQLVEGGMGEITRLLADSVRDAGGRIVLNAAVARVVAATSRNSLHEVHLADGSVLPARHVILAADPVNAVRLVDDSRFAELRDRVRSLHEPGTSLKVNLALSRLPDVVGSSALLGSPTAALSGTVHVLPIGDPMAAFERASRAVREGRWPDPADSMIDVYTHTAVDPSLCDAPPDKGGRHAMSLFIQWVPSNAEQEDAERWVDALLQAEPMRRFFGENFGGGDAKQVAGEGGRAGSGGGLADLIVDRMVLTPRGIESRFGIAGGHIHHLDNRHAWTDRLAERTPIEGLWLASAGCHPAGSVIGAAGLIAADGVLDFAQKTKS